MKKRTKLFATLTAICASICMMVIGVLAANQVNLNVTSNVSFESNGTYVKVKGEVQKGNADTEPVRAIEPEGSDYYYIGYSYDAVDEEQETDAQASDYNDIPVGTSSFTLMTTWIIGNVEFSESESIIRYSLTFSNYSEKPVQATITTNKDTFLSDPEIQGKVSISETSKSVIIYGSDGTTPKTATYTITLTLTNFSTSFTNKGLTIDVNFSTEIKEPEIEELVPGLSVFISDEDKKEAKIVSYTGNALNIVVPETFSIAGKEMPNSFTLDNLFFQPATTYLALLYLGDFNITLRNGTKIEEMNFFEFNTQMESISEGAFPITFEQTYNLKIENNESDMQMLAVLPTMVTETFMEYGVIVEVPKVKENGSTEWRELQDVEEFSIYVSSIMETPEEANFPLEFKFEPPKYMAAVEGNDYIITSIGDSVFSGFSSLTSMVLPSTLTSIGSYAFSGCTSLTSITIPEGVTSIGDQSFFDCRSLTSITLPSTLTSIGSRAFNDCFALVEVYNLSILNITAGSLSYGSVGEYAKVIHASKEEPSRINREGGVQYYEYGDEIIAFAPMDRNLTNITLKEGTTEINRYAFYECSNLTNVAIPESVTSIGDESFFDCYSLTSITLPSSVTSIGRYAFSGCFALVEVYNLSILNITAGSLSYGSVGEYAKVIHASKEEPSRITNDGEMQYYEYDGEIIALAPIDRDITNVTLKKGTTEIYQHAFLDCSSLTNITLPNGLSSIKDSAFSGCTSLINITLPNSVTSIGGYAFFRCYALTSIKIPNRVIDIGNSAFEFCDSLESITIPSSVIYIGRYVFGNCTSLKYIQITGNLTSSYTLPSGTWVKTDSAAMPTDWTTNVVTSISTTNSAGYYHQQSAWENAN